VDYLDKTKGIFKKAISSNASDLHLVANEYPTIRVDDKLMQVEGEERLAPSDCEKMIQTALKSEHIDRLKAEKEVDFSFNFDGARIRTNVYFERGNVAAAFRFIPEKVRLVSELALPPLIQEFATREQGLVIVSGPTGHGKSTTIAALVEYINQNTAKHIVTVEDPVEYVFKNQKSIINQRELGTDTLSFAKALRSVLREDPDVVFIGEMRDVDTFEAALTIAETGHLVFTTLHTNNAAQTIERIIDSFDIRQQTQVRIQLASSLLGIFSQRLIPRVSGGLIPAVELLINNSAVANLIRENRVHEINSVIETSSDQGMIDLNRYLSDLVRAGEITLENAYLYSQNSKGLDRMI